LASVITYKISCNPYEDQKTTNVNGKKFALLGIYNNCVIGSTLDTVCVNFPRVFDDRWLNFSGIGHLEAFSNIKKALGNNGKF
jgi:hypothetical protein